jgi:pilus assembly protein Flp/PilA
MRKIANWFRNEESGQGMIEYALIIGLISIAAIAILILLGPKISNLFSNVNSKL